MRPPPLLPAGDQAETVLMRTTRASGIAGLAGIMSAVWDLSREACSCMLVHSCAPPAGLQHASCSLACTPAQAPAAALCRLGTPLGIMVPCSQERRGSDLHAHPLAPAKCATVEVCCPAAKGGVGQAPVLNLRPLLNMHKHELEALLREQGIRWVRDPTNIDEDYLRNHLRALMQHLPAPALPAHVVGQASSAWGPPPVRPHNTVPSAVAAAPNGAQGGGARQAAYWPQQQQQRPQQQHAYPAGPGPGGRRAARQPRSRVIQAVRGHSSGEAIAAADLAGPAALQQQRSLHADLLRVGGACSELDDVLRQQAGALLLGGRPVVHVSLPDAGVSPATLTYVSSGLLGQGTLPWLLLGQEALCSLPVIICGWLNAPLVWLALIVRQAVDRSAPVKLPKLS